MSDTPTTTPPPPAVIPSTTENVADGYLPPEDVFKFTQSIRTKMAVKLLSGDITIQDPKITALGVKVLRDMDASETAVKRLAIDNKIAGDNAAIARDLIVAAYNNKANGLTPHIQTPTPNASAEPAFKPPEDILPGFTPNADIQGVGVADRTYEEVIAGAPPKPTST